MLQVLPQHLALGVLVMPLNLDRVEEILANDNSKMPIQQEQVPFTIESLQQQFIEAQQNYFNAQSHHLQILEHMNDRLMNLLEYQISGPPTNTPQPIEEVDEDDSEPDHASHGGERS